MRIQRDYLNDYTSLHFILEQDFTGNKIPNSEITSRSIQTDKLCQFFFSLLVNSKYVICKEDMWTVISAFIVVPHQLLKLSQCFGIQCSQNLQGQWLSDCGIQWKRPRVLYIHTWRSGHRRYPLDNIMTMLPHT